MENACPGLSLPHMLLFNCEAYLLIGWIVYMSSCIAADHLADTLQLLIASFQAPEASSALHVFQTRSNPRRCNVHPLPGNKT